MVYYRNDESSPSWPIVYVKWFSSGVTVTRVVSVVDERCGSGLLKISDRALPKTTTVSVPCSLSI